MRQLRFVRRWTRRQFYLLTALTLKLDLIFFHRLWLKESQDSSSLYSPDLQTTTTLLTCQRRAIVPHLRPRSCFSGQRGSNELRRQNESKLAATVNQCQRATKKHHRVISRVLVSFLAEFAAAAVKLWDGHPKFLTRCSSASRWWAFNSVFQRVFSCLTMWRTTTILEPRPKTLPRFPHSGYNILWTGGMQIIE